MVNCALVLLSSNVSQCSWSSILLTLLVLLYLLVAYLAARRCTISTLLVRVLVYGLQTEEQYSRCGLTSDVKALLFTEVLDILKFLRRKPRVLFAFLVILSIWMFQERLFVRLTPRYLVPVSDSKMWPF